MTNHHNGLKTLGLFGFMWVILLAIGYLIAHGTGNPLWIGLFGLFAVGSSIYTYWNSASLALRSMSAYPVTRAQQPQLYSIVEELSRTANQPMPALYVAPTASPNAFATGRDPAHAAVCCTEGILALLDRRELRGVLGHELMHVYNRDILTSSIAQAMAGIITSVAQMFYFFGSGYGDRDEGGSPLGALGGIGLAVLAPLASSLIQLAISRTREYDADEDGARLTRDPLALASALKKLEAGAGARPLQHTPRTEAVAHVMIANPFRATNLLSTHPPMRQRIERLEKMAGY